MTGTELLLALALTAVLAYRAGWSVGARKSLRAMMGGARPGLLRRLRMRLHVRRCPDCKAELERRRAESKTQQANEQRSHEQRPFGQYL